MSASAELPKDHSHHLYLIGGSGYICRAFDTWVIVGLVGIGFFRQRKSLA